MLPDKDTENTEAMRPRLRRLLAWLRLGFTPLALVFLMIAGWQSHAALVTVMKNASLLHLLGAACIWLLLHTISPLFTVLALRTCGSSIGYPLALKVHVGRLPARYIPGGVWHTVARLVDFHDFGVKPAQLAAFVFLEHALAVSVTFLIGGICLLLTREVGIWKSLAAVAAVAGLCALLVAPVIVNRLILKRTGRLNVPGYLSAAAITLLFWLMAASAFSVYVAAFPAAFSGHSVLEIAGTYLFSWGIGFVAIFAPQGIGVFEAVAGDMLAAPSSFVNAAVLIAGFRAVVLAGDTCAFLLLWVWLRLRGRARLS
jgi:hypothetical protein